MAADTLAVQLSGIEKRFPGVIANHDVNLNVRPGTIHAIVGENGAGKSTLMKTLYGMHQPEAGTIHVFGEHLVFKSPSDAIDAGIGMVHQHFMLADNLTVLENIVLGSEPTTKGVVKFDEARMRLEEIMTQSGTHVDLDVPVSELGVGKRQRVEILKVLFRGARVLILDEPTAVLVPQEVEELFGNLHRLVADGATIIFISHKLDEVLTVSDDITVIRAGTTVAEVKPNEVTRSKLAELMVGSELPSPHGRTSEIGTKIRLKVDGLTLQGPGEKALLEDISFEVREGEVLGIAGVEGNGQFELCEAIIGLLRPEGTIVIDDVDVSHASPHQRLIGGLSYIPFDRHREGLLLSAPLWENTLLGRDADPEFQKGPFVNTAAARADSRTIIQQFDVRTPSETVPAYALSGGNQQKMLVGRELSSRPHVLIAAHPTRGVDIGAQAAIWEKLRVARDAGLAVLLISADLEELIGLSDRIVVMFDGRINARLTPAEATPELLGTYMTGGIQEVAP